MDSSVIEADGFFFLHDFDSGNLGRVVQVPPEQIMPSLNSKTNSVDLPDFEFNLWTRPDCAGTEFENGNRTWFYFGIQGGRPGATVRLNLINLNKQGKMYNQGMAPVTRTLPGKPHWERIRDKPIHCTDENSFTLSFKYRTPESAQAITFFAFTYPYSFTELQIALGSIDHKLLPAPRDPQLDEIYYCRECLVYSLEGRRVDLLTISSHHGITAERETRLRNLFPEKTLRPFKFEGKKVVFVSARVHPGETPSSFVFNGFLNLILTKNDPIALALRRMYVFKLIPFLNPDGVARGHYRTDTRGVNLNRVYLNPSISLHPTIYAARALIRYHHFGCEKDELSEDTKLASTFDDDSISNISSAENLQEPPRIKKSFKGERGLCMHRGQKRVDSLQTALSEQMYEIKLDGADAQAQAHAEGEGEGEAESGSRGQLPAQQASSLLSAETLRGALGCEVRVTSSEQLSCVPSNPLRPLRDSIKDSIGLLIATNANSTLDTDVTSRNSGQFRVGLCAACLDQLSHRSCKPILVNQSAKVDSGTDSEDLREQVVLCSVCLKKFTFDRNNKEIVLHEEPPAPVPSAGTGLYCVDAAPAPAALTPPSAVTDHNVDADRLAECVGSRKSRSPAKARRPTALRARVKEPDSGLFLYIDLHGHASKKGIFMYGNHFEELERCVECMLLPRIMSLNNIHFHFSSCNFTERNMYLKDKRDGMSREGSGRVAVLKATGLVRSYTLECNYNTGRLVNVLPPTVRESVAGLPSASVPPPHQPPPPPLHAPAPPKYTPHIFEEVGRSLGSSILDLTGHHPNSRIPASEHRTLHALRDHLRSSTRAARPHQLTVSRLRAKAGTSPTTSAIYTRPISKTKIDPERKENTYIGAKIEVETKRSQLRSKSTELTAIKLLKKDTKSKSFVRSRLYAESDPKTKLIPSKRRNVLAIRKPNATKNRSATSIVKKQIVKRLLDDSDATKSKGRLTLAQYRRETAARGETSRSLAVASSSGLELGRCREASTHFPAKKRPFVPNSAPLKKIRLKPAT